MIRRNIGVIGDGQLARMMYAPAVRLGLNLHLLAQTEGSSAASVFSSVQMGDYNDPATVTNFARSVDVITFDHEHVPTTILQALEAEGVAVYPGSSALQYAQDKWLMRQKLSALGVPVPTWRRCATPTELKAFGDEIGWPIIAKSSRGGYDGHGVWKLDTESVAVPFGEIPETSAGEPVTIIGEEYIAFERELSVIAVRSLDGDVRTYEVTATEQIDGVCRETISPAPGLSGSQKQEICEMARTIADELGVVGVLAVELMQRVDGSVVVNELAMRPHNTGHWTIDGAATSQFANHVRAVAGLPLGSTRTTAPWCVMTNILGKEGIDPGQTLAEVLDDDEIHVELYGKEVCEGRKIGHVTCTGDDYEQVMATTRDAVKKMGQTHE